MYACSAYDLNHTDDVDCIFCTPCCMCTQSHTHRERERHAQPIHTNAHSIIPQAIHTIDNNNNIHNKSNASSNDGGGGGGGSSGSNNDIIITTAAAILWRVYHTYSCMFKRQCERACTSVCSVCSRSKWINAKETTQFGWGIKKATTTPPPLITAAATTITTTTTANTLCESTNGITAIVMTVYVQQENLFDHVVYMWSACMECLAYNVCVRAEKNKCENETDEKGSPCIGLHTLVWAQIEIRAIYILGMAENMSHSVIFVHKFKWNTHVSLVSSLCVFNASAMCACVHLCEGSIVPIAMIIFVYMLAFVLHFILGVFSIFWQFYRRRCIWSGIYRGRGWL